MAIALLSLIGFFVAFYLMAHSFGWTGPLICGIGECDTVQASQWAKVGPVPVSAIGVLGYVALLVVAFVGLQPGGRDSTAVSLLLLAGASFGFAASLWFTYVEAFLIRAWCQWCVISAILMTLIFVASLPEIARLRGGGS